MKDVEKLFGTAVNEIECLLNTKTVVGEPIKVDDITLIPLISIGFGFGVGGGEGTDPGKGTGTGGGTGSGGGVKAIALILINFAVLWCVLNRNSWTRYWESGVTASFVSCRSNLSL